MDDARRLVEAGEPVPLVVTADEQQRARGRLGRMWSAPPGGVWLTYAMRVDRRTAASLTPRVAVGVCEVTERVAGLTPGELAVKWPNDVLLNDRKLVGILCELVGGAGGTAVMLIGIGVNTDVSVEEDLPPEVRDRAISLRDATGRAPNVEVLTERIIAMLDALGAAAEGDTLGAHRALESRLAWRGELVRVRIAGRAGAEGRIDRVDEYSRLVVRTAAGEPVIIESGEIERIERVNDANEPRDDEINRSV